MQVSAYALLRILLDDVKHQPMCATAFQMRVPHGVSQGTVQKIESEHGTAEVVSRELLFLFFLGFIGSVLLGRWLCFMLCMVNRCILLVV